MGSLSQDYKGLNLEVMAHRLDGLFGFASEWDCIPTSEFGCYEFGGRIQVDLSTIDGLCADMHAGPADAGQIFRYVFAHLKVHHYQELNPTYEKSYMEDMRPYELEADLVAGWICAAARISDLFRTHGMASDFSDFARVRYMTDPPDTTPRIYPWPVEKEYAFRRGARMWAAGRVGEYNPAAAKQGMEEETFDEFLVGVPWVVRGLWSRPVPSTASR